MSSEEVKKLRGPNSRLVGAVPWMSKITGVDGQAQAITKELLNKDGYGAPDKMMMLKLGPLRLVFNANPEIVSETIKRTDTFEKVVAAGMGPTGVARGWVGNGLFTSGTAEEVWQKAHRVIPKAFSIQAMKNAVPVAVSTCQKMLDAWEKLTNEHKEIDVSHWTTKMTFDVICNFAFTMGMDSVSSAEEHPFVTHLMRAASNSQLVADASRYPIRGPRVKKKLQKAIDENVAFLRKFIQNYIEERKRAPRQEKSDILDRMLFTKDEVTDSYLSEDNVMSQMITFMFAGHDSTSTTICNTLYCLSQNPDVEELLRAEIAEKADGKTLDMSVLMDMPYLDKVIKEGLRIFPPAEGFALTCSTDSTLGGYKVKAGYRVIHHAITLHLDPAYWATPNRFNPEHFSEEAVKARPFYSYIPFGGGVRACVGMQLALIETKVAVIMALQRFNFRLSQTCKPTLVKKLFRQWEDVCFKMSPRRDAGAACRRTSIANLDKMSGPADAIASGIPVKILYASNMGTGEGYAQELADDLTQLGFHVFMSSVDGQMAAGGTEFWNSDVNTIIVASTYNGKPPDNAVKFARQMAAGEVAKVAEKFKYAVFGCGNSNWNTFQQFPRAIADTLTKAGATPLLPLGEGDASKNLDSVFQAWKKQLLAALFKASDITPTENQSTALPETVAVATSEKKASEFTEPWKQIAPEAEMGEVEEIRELQSETSSRSTKHITIGLPIGMSYRAGSHLLVVPRNKASLVEALAERVGTKLDELIELTSTKRLSHFPLGKAVTARELLTNCVEINQPSSGEMVQMCYQSCECPPEKEALKALMETAATAVLMTPLELLQKFKSVQLSFAGLLSVLPALKPRLYSISSSELAQEHSATVTVGRVTGINANSEQPFEGLCSSFLGDLEVGAELAVCIRGLQGEFHLPLIDQTPVVLIGPGTGFAPMRGFLQEMKAREYRGKALLFFGCRSASEDHIYKEEMVKAEEEKVLTSLFTAYSRDGDKKVYVQDQIWDNRTQIWEMINQDKGMVFICGDAKNMAKAVFETLIKVFETEGAMVHEEAVTYMDQLCANNRYLADLFSS